MTLDELISTLTEIREQYKAGEFQVEHITGKVREDLTEDMFGINLETGTVTLG